MTHTIEFFGGPMNGEIRTIPNDMEVFTCYTFPKSPPPTGDAEMSIDPITHIYRLDERSVGGPMLYHGTVDKEEPPIQCYLNRTINLTPAAALTFAEIMEGELAILTDELESKGALPGSIRFHITVRPFSARPSVHVDARAYKFAHYENERKK